jgi:hypothetical protein
MCTLLYKKQYGESAMKDLRMDEEKLSDAITNLELAQHQMKKMYESMPIDIENKKHFSYTIQLIRESIDILRNFEIRNEIERFSVSDDE